MKRACLLLLPALMVITLVATGCKDESKPIITRVRVTPECGVVPLRVETFGAVSGGNETGDPMGANNLLEMTWNFGDGGTGTSSTAYHRYDAPGEYSITVTARDQDGNTVSSAVPVTVLADSLVIAASSNFPGGNVTTGQVIQFEIEAVACDIDYPTNPGDAVKMAFRWEMGDADGTVHDGATPAFTYSTPGEYDVNVYVTHPAQSVTRMQTLHFSVAAP